MLSKKHKTIILSLTSVVIGVTALGGVVNAQNAANTQNAITTQNNFGTQEYKFPPADAVKQIKPQSAPAVNQVTKPVANTQPGRRAQTYPMPYPAQRAAPYYGGPGAPRPYNMPYNNRPVYGNVPYGRQYNPGPYNNSYNRGPYNNPYNRGPYNNPYNRGPYNNPYNRGPYNNPYNRDSNNGPFGGGSPFDNFGGGPFNSNNPPWEEWPLGAPDSFWNRKENPFKNQNPTDWFQPEDPKEGMAVMWDDLIAAPDDLGTMPGGWNVPSISVPNPVDLEDQLEEASKEVPDLIRVYND